MNIAWREEALDDLESVRAYVAADDPAAAARLVSRVFEAIELLVEHPALGRAGRVPRTRELIVAGTPFIVAYRVRDEVVDVLRVLHAARQWPPPAVVAPPVRVGRGT